MSDEVSQFLEQVEQLRGKQTEDYELRAREREEFMAAKRQRQARREERARSISPQKSSPANTPSPRTHVRNSASLSTSLKHDSSLLISNDHLHDSSLYPSNSRGMGFPQSPTKENEAPLGLDADSKHATHLHHSETSSPAAQALAGRARSSTLTWQQRRPESRGATTARPLSMVAVQNASQRGVARMQTSSSPPHSDSQHQTLSRQDIAKTLGLKDPSWFRQTADRGQGSAALRKSPVEDANAIDMSSVKAQLSSLSDAQADPVTGSISPAPFSPLPSSSPGFGAQDGSHRNNSNSQARTPSPTKGLGGFVQSAMMKRNDSFKRWSATSSPIQGRADADSGNVVSHAEASPVISRPRSKTHDLATPESSRPASQNDFRDAKNAVTPETSSHTALSRETSDSRLNTSPSKTMDSRRWSPTKSSWLDSALNRPDSPRLQHKSTASQPDWMTELARSKAAASPSGKGSRSSSPHKHQVSIGGLMRTTPFDGGAKTNTPGLGGIYSPPDRPQVGHASKYSISAAPAEHQSASSLDLEPSQTPTPRHIESQVKSETKIVASIDSTPQTESPAMKPFTRSSVVSSPPTTNLKPVTPPQKDFRASLRQRPTNSGPKQAEEAEFRNALGNLRRTKTQNYVAPDELKGNILRGKAALAVTGGPQKTERKDEFKESILKKREDFKKAQADGKGVTRSSPSSSQPSALPEGLAKRAELGKIGSTRENSFVTGSSAATSKRPEPFTKPAPAPKPVTVRSPGSKQEANTNPSTNLPQGRSEGSKLAARFNPNLANLLARGPPLMASNGGGQRSDEKHGTNPAPAVEPSAPGPQLTHITKGRARGPKRRVPASAAAPKGAASPIADSKPTGPKTDAIPAEITTSELDHKSAVSSVQDQAITGAATPEKPSFPRPWETPTNTTRAESSLPAQTSLEESLMNQASRSVASPYQKDSASQDIAENRKSRPLSASRFPKFAENAETNDASEPSPSPRSAQSHSFESISKSTVSPKPISSPRVAAAAAAASPRPAPISIPASASASPDKPRTPRENQYTTPTRAMPSRSFGTVGPGSPRFGLHGPRPQTESRPKSRGEGPLSSAGFSASVSVPGSPIPCSPTKQSGEIISLFKDFFGPPRPRKDYKVDTAEVLMNHAEAGAKIQTQAVQMYRLSGDGKRTPVLAQNERILYDGEMYICAHVFKNADGKSLAELYFWVGDEVPDAMAQDGLVFAQQEAKAIDGRLLKVYQGKETAEFMQALGGVIIVWRGHSTRFDSLASHMLCGRRYLGQVAFDEVDMTTDSLCSGFPFLVSHGGKCILWKGKGSDVDELSAARLVGMELSLLGELTEVDEGEEPVSFWELFEEGQSNAHSADHWRLKPNYRKYGSRLFCSNADARHQITEIVPFNQTDLSPLKIFVLDAFFEVYIVVGSGAQSQYSSFRNALDFAQEYAILSAGMEDRPFVPVSTIVLEGIPRDLKRVFRKWEEGRSPTVTNTYSGLKRKRSLRVVPLAQALQALNE